jgi:glycosyltransferase involved in cell wall biosynthesis
MNEQTKKIHIIIPAYNEATVIGDVIKDLQEGGYNDILVVNDGSKDDTEKMALEAGAEVLNHIINRGQGAALRTGIEFVREQYNPDIIVTFDADGQHCVKDIATLIQPIIEKDIDIVLGSRFLKNNSKIPFIRKLILKAGIIFTNFISNIKLTDTHNGLRALSRKAFNSIQIYHRGMEHASDIIDEITLNKLSYSEVPVQISYTCYSKLKGQKSGGFMKMGIKIILKKILQ